MKLNEIYDKVNKCDKCGLCKNRIVNSTFRGSEKARIMLIGEAPGSTEQRIGKPFIGRSGKLLDRILSSIKISPETDVFITNLVKHRPIDYTTGKDRKPFYDEVVTCAPYLMEEMEILKPSLVVTLGKSAGDWFANYEPYEINRFYSERKWLPLYHPSYLARMRAEILPFGKALREAYQLVTF
jgi:uracil-DNA glycosylase